MSELPELKRQLPNLVAMANTELSRLAAAACTTVQLDVPTFATLMSMGALTAADAAQLSERGMQVFLANHVFGPAGVLEQEDGENWTQSTKQTTGYGSGKIPHLLKMALGRGKIVKQDGLARIDGATNEHGQLWTYGAWAAYVRGAGWDEIKSATTPGDTF